jgi:hypothetical protein
MGSTTPSGTIESIPRGCERRFTETSSQRRWALSGRSANVNIKVGIWCAVVACVSAHTAGMVVFAQSAQRVSGSWSASEGKVGLVLQKGDNHPYFLYGHCQKPGREVRLNLEIEPKLFGDAIAKEEYIIVRWSDGTTNVDSIVERIFLNEAGQYGWSPSLTVGQQTIDFWLRAGRLELTVGVREKDGFNARQSYLLPNENRREAVASFMQSCFGAVSPNAR